MTARWALALSVATAILVASSGGEAPPSVWVPAGLPVALDGVLGDGEWGDALAIPISDAVTLHLKCVDGALCLGVRAPEMGVGNLLIADGDNVRILHSSAALGTAVYEPAGDAWRLKADFVWRCRSLGASEVANAERRQFLEADGWLASTAYMGNPGDLEYQIALGAQPIRIAFLWLPVSDPRSVLSWPAGVSQDIIPGPIPSAAHFDVSEWATVTMLTASQAATRATSEAPAGTIAFSSSRDGNTDIYTIRADGSGLKRVTTTSSQELEPCWRPDGVRLAYQARRPAWQIYTALVDGSDEQAVTNHLSWSPAWSPDGLWLAFHSDKAGNQDVYVLDLGSGDLRQLTHEPSRDFLATWSPDGTRLAFTSDRDGNLEIYTIRSDGSDPVRLTDHPAEDLLPAWSPSGEWIAFVSARDGNREIYLMRPDGSCVVRLTDNPGEDMYPAWKPE